MRTPSTAARRRRQTAGISLVETMLSVILLSLILLGTVNMIVNALRSYSQVGDISTSVEKSQGANRSLEGELIKGFLVILPNDAAPFPTWNATTLGAASNHTYTNGTTVQTAVYIVYPNTRTLSVYNTSGGTISLSGANALNDRSQTSPTKSALIYRGNADGSTNASSGTYLWIKRFSAGSQVSNTVLTNKVHTAWNAVNFQRTSTRYDSVQLTVVTGQQSGNRGWSSNHTTATSSAVTNLPVRSLVLPNAATSYNIVVP